MGAKRVKLLPKEKRILENIGENIKLARLRRKFTTEQVANRANISRKTLWHVEKGSEHISIGVILQVLSVLGLKNDLTNIFTFRVIHIEITRILKINSNIIWFSEFSPNFICF